MINYILWGLLFTFIFDIILKGTDNEFNNVERLAFVVLWPIAMIWFVYYVIRNMWNNGR
jgi:hypothetical protein